MASRSKIKSFLHYQGLLVETETCKRNSTAYSQSCPDEDRDGFVFEDEFSPDWTFLEQTKVLIYHSGIAEFAFVGNVTGWSNWI